MQNRRERRKLLKQFGLLKSDLKKGALSNIEEGKEIHRRYLQEMKNSQMKSQAEKNSDSLEIPKNEFFMYRETPHEYGSFQSMLLNRNWDEIEKD
jgi:5-bromo-4-chloroindolyl phosphate hydrolysis protein